MLIKKEKDLKKQIETGGISGIYLLCGSEEYLVTSWKNLLVKNYKDDTFGFAKLDGSLMDMSELYDATQQLSMFGGGRCVLFENVDIKKLNKEALESLETIIKDNPEDTVLVITAPNLDGKLVNAKKLIALVDKHGTVVEFAQRDTASLVKHVQTILKQNGTSIAAADAKELVRLCGNDMQKITVEAQKLAAYANGRTATSEDVALIVIPTIEERVFDLGKAIFAGNTNRALEITKNLISLKESPVMIIATLVMSYVDLYRAKTGQKMGLAAPELGKALGYKGNQFRLNNAYSTKISPEAVVQSLEVLYATDKQLKSTMVDNNLLLERTVLELIYIRES